jgi:hypothetical protein
VQLLCNTDSHVLIKPPAFGPLNCRAGVKDLKLHPTSFHLSKNPRPRSEDASPKRSRLSMPNAFGDARNSNRCPQASQTAPFTCERSADHNWLVSSPQYPHTRRRTRHTSLAMTPSPRMLTLAHVDLSRSSMTCADVVTPWLKLTEAVSPVAKDGSNVMNFVRVVSPAQSPTENVYMLRRPRGRRRPSTMAQNQLRTRHHPSRLRAQPSLLQYHQL